MSNDNNRDAEKLRKHHADIMRGAGELREKADLLATQAEAQGGWAGRFALWVAGIAKRGADWKEGKARAKARSTY